MATESILMAGVAAGGDRQVLHELIRQHSQAAALVVKQEAKPNDLLDRLAADPEFANLNLSELSDPQSFIGRAEQQVHEFIGEVVDPLLASVNLGQETSAEVKV
jgi:adenylosuccinate lyase